MKLIRVMNVAAVFGALSIGLFTGSAHAQGNKDAGSAPAAVKTSAQPAPAPAATEPKKADAPAPAAGKDAPVAKVEYVRMTTSLGDIFIELDGEKAPISVTNFLKYVDKKHYDGTVFHRVISTFMIQGGGYDEGLKQKPVDAPIQNEWQNGLKNIRGSLAVARTAVANSGTSQFFINVVDNPFLDQPRDGAAYAVFGRVVSGIEVVDQIKSQKTGTKNGMSDIPLQTVKIVSVTRVTREEALKGAPMPDKK